MLSKMWCNIEPPCCRTASVAQIHFVCPRQTVTNRVFDSEALACSFRADVRRKAPHGLQKRPAREGVFQKLSPSEISCCG